MSPKSRHRQAIYRTWWPEFVIEIDDAGQATFPGIGPLRTRSNAIGCDRPHSSYNLGGRCPVRQPIGGLGQKRVQATGGLDAAQTGRTKPAGAFSRSPLWGTRDCKLPFDCGKRPAGANHVRTSTPLNLFPRSSPSPGRLPVGLSQHAGRDQRLDPGAAAALPEPRAGRRAFVSRAGMRLFVFAVAWVPIALWSSLGGRRHWTMRRGPGWP